MADVLRFLPEIDGDEMLFIGNMMKDMNDETAQQFSMVYRSRRRDAQTIMLMALIGFIGVSGVHRFYLGQVGMGLLYLLTAGLCFIGTIVDLVNYRTLALEYNQLQAQQILMMLNIKK